MLSLTDITGRDARLREGNTGLLDNTWWALALASNYTVYQRISAIMKQTKPDVFTSTNQEGVDRVLKEHGKYAFFMESTSIEYEMERQCELTQINGLLDSKGYGIALPISKYLLPLSRPSMACLTARDTASSCLSVSTFCRSVDRVLKEHGKYAFFMESTSIEYEMERQCELTQINGLLDSKGYGIALPISKYLLPLSIPSMACLTARDTASSCLSVSTFCRSVDRVLKEHGKYAFFMESTSIEYEMERQCELTQINGLLDSKGYGIEHGKYAFFMESTSIEYEMERQCELMQINGLLDSKGYGIALPISKYLLPLSRPSMACLTARDTASPCLSVSTFCRSVDRVLKEHGKYAFFMESTSIEYELERQCELMQINGLLDSKGYGIALPISKYLLPLSRPSMACLTARDTASPCLSVSTFCRSVDRVLKEHGKYAFFMESTSIEYEMERQCELTQINCLLDSKGYGIALPINSPYRTFVSEAVLKLSENGRIKDIKDKWWLVKDGTGCSEIKVEEENADELTMANVGGVFLVLMVGVFAAFLVAILEMLWNCRKIAVEEKIILGLQLAKLLECSPLYGVILGFYSQGSQPQKISHEYRVQRCCWSESFLGNLPFLLLLCSGIAPYLPHFNLIGSRDVVFESQPHLSAPLQIITPCEALISELKFAVNLSQTTKPNRKKKSEKSGSCNSSSVSGSELVQDNNK
ncbi:hypothetical protein PR048_033042 [Dryococelus australis]|uniref:Ionotropic glutamate receptor C-terminal domain-containing protein n=1 Tax=Dryococelus australis TaxID=614101 RepID=A0ABQ9G718_9NEOP|nr:hypothetical protein PR048_033042 [Dryococelus australis]